MKLGQQCCDFDTSFLKKKSQDISCRINYIFRGNGIVEKRDINTRSLLLTRITFVDGAVIISEMACTR